MKDCLTLIPGDVVQTLGYYEENDGGEGLYEIVNNSSLKDDGGSVHDLDNGFKAKLIITDSINIKQFGAKGDGITDDTNVLKYIFETYCNDGDVIYIPKGIFIFSDNIVCSKKVNVKGHMINDLTPNFSTLKNIGNGSGLTFTADDVYIYRLSVVGNGDTTNGYGIKMTGIRPKLRDVTCAEFRSQNAIGLQIGDDNEYHNVDIFYIDNVYTHNCDIGCKIGTALYNSEDKTLTDANAGTIAKLSTQNNRIGLWLKNANCNTIISLHSETNSDYGVYMENAFNNIFIRPFLEDTNSLYFDETSIHNIVIGSRTNMYLESVKGNGADNNDLLLNSSSKGIRNIWNKIKTYFLRIGKSGEEGYWDFEHSGTNLTIKYPYANGVIDMTNSDNPQTLKVNNGICDKIKVNTNSNTNLTNMKTILNYFSTLNVPAKSIATRLITVDELTNDTNFMYWSAIASFDDAIDNNLLYTVEVQNGGVRFKFYNPTENLLSVQNTNVKILLLKHYTTNI